MRVWTVALPLGLAGVLPAQNRCEHAGRNALIGGGVGATLIVGVILSAPKSHEPENYPSRVTSTPALMVTWAGAWGAGIGSALAVGGNRCFPPPVYRRDASGRCGSAIRTGALRGSIGGAALGFLVSPVLALPLMVPLTPGGAGHFNLDHFMGVVTASGAVLGAPFGALNAATQCRRS